MLDLPATISAMQSAGMTDTEIVKALSCFRLIPVDRAPVPTDSPTDNEKVPTDSPPEKRLEKLRANDRARKRRLRALGNSNGQETKSTGQSTEPPLPSPAPPSPPLSPEPQTPPLTPPTLTLTPEEPPKKPQNKALRGTRLPENWYPEEQSLVRFTDKGMSPEVFERELLKFRNYWGSKAGAKGVMIDWNKTYVNWMLRVEEDGRLAG